MTYKFGICFQCGQPFEKCICAVRFKPLIPPTVNSLFAIYSRDESKSCNMSDLIVDIYQIMHGREFVTALGLSYELDPNDMGIPTPEEAETALDVLVDMGIMEKIPGNYVLDRYRAVVGAPMLGIGG